MTASEHPLCDDAALDPALPIVDPHHHLWDHGAIPGVAADASRFMLAELIDAMAVGGHNITRTVFVECRSMYRCDGPEDLRPVGETEFANGVAAMSASGRYGKTRVADGIVATANLLLGAEVTPVLEAQVAAGNGRVRGVRFTTAYSDAGLFGRPADVRRRGILTNAMFREGARVLPTLGLSLDVWCLHPQLPELAEFAAACPQVTIVLDHLGTPLKLDAALGAKAEVFAQWQADIREVARRPNVVVKLGGLGMDVSATIGATRGHTPARQLADLWRPYIEVCVEAFGARRCMFESNFPVDAATCSYGALWSAFKMITADCSADEQAALFSTTATAIYRLVSSA